MKILELGRDRKLQTTYAIPISDHNCVHVGNTSQQFYIPADAKTVLFSPASGVNFTIKTGASPSAPYPSGEVADGSAGMINPSFVNVVSGELLAICTDSETGAVGFSFYGE